MFFRRNSLFSILVVCGIQQSFILGKCHVHCLQIFEIIYFYSNFFSCDSFAADTVCHLCNSKQSSDCLDIAQESSSVRKCVSELNHCYTIHTDNAIQRGCVGAGDAYFPNLASIGECKNPDECKVCTDSHLCNDQAVTDTCIKCTSSESIADCSTVTKAVPCSLKKHFAESDGCYSKAEDSTTYTRGCMRDLDGNQKKLCQQKNTKCQSCKYPNCNLKETFITPCFECNGEKNSTCADSTRLASQVDCDDYAKTCATGIDQSGYTHRGCFSYNFLSSLFPNGFKLCPKRLCNNEIFPLSRPKCYQCEGKYECPTLKNLEPSICNIYPDQCFAYLDNSLYFLISIICVQVSA